MSYHEYLASRDLAMQDLPFYGLIMAAMRQADTYNAAMLRLAFPRVWDELQARHDAPGGHLGDD